MARTATVTRKTAETEISITLNVDGSGKARLDYPVGFMAHMLRTFACHGSFDLDIKAQGDLEVDQHHLIEDTGIVLGKCFADSLGERRGVRRVGSCLFPMDETLARAACDLSGRPFLVYNAGLDDKNIGAFQADTIEDFWQAFVVSSAITLHLDVLRGRSGHHKIEALFKAASRALKDACAVNPLESARVISAKGVLV